MIVKDALESFKVSDNNKRKKSSLTSPPSSSPQRRRNHYWYTYSVIVEIALIVIMANSSIEKIYHNCSTDAANVS